MNLKKIGLTALAGSLVATSLVAGEMTVTGSASMKVRHVDGGAANGGKAFSMGNQMEFAGSGELDNGLNVSLSFVLDQNDDSTTAGTAKSVNSGSPFDSHSVSISSDALGTLVFHGEGGSSAQTAIDTTAAGDLWDNGYGISTTDDPKTSATSDNMIFYTLPTLVDDVALTASYTPKGTGADSSTAMGIGYTGVEGLSLNYARGEANGTAAATVDVRTMKASYAYGSFTVSASDTEYDSEVTTTTVDQDVTSWNISYTVSDNISVSYGVDEIALPDVSTDEDIEVSALSASYTTGGMTISGMMGSADNMSHTTAVTEDREMWHLVASFAF
jgi:outer membrane protein OmpU